MPNKRQRSNNGKRTQNNRKKSQKIPKKARVQYARSVIPTTSYHLTGCARDYISCLSNPFRNISPLPCIPDLINVPSNKFRTRIITTTITNDAGQAQVGCFPFNTHCNSRVSLYTNTSAWVPALGNDFEFSTATAGVVASVANSPYSDAFFNSPTIQVRPVGCAVEIRYAGTELQRGGTITLFRSQANLPFSQGAISQLMANPSARKVPMERHFFSVAYVPDDPDFLGYQSQAEMLAAVTPSNPGATLIIVVSGAQPKQTFEVEVSAYWEMIGNLVGSTNNNYTASHTDLPGMAAAISAIGSKISAKTPQLLESNMIQRAGQYLLTGTSYAVGALLPPLARAGLGAVLSQRAVAPQLEYGGKPPTIEEEQ